MTCCIDTYRAAVGCFAGILVKILTRKANIAALRVRGFKVKGLSAMLTVYTLLLCLLIAGVEPNPGPGEMNKTADHEIANNNDDTTPASRQTTLESLSTCMKTLMDSVTRLEQTQGTLMSDMDQKLHRVGESIRQSIEDSNQSLKRDISLLQTSVSAVDDKVEKNKGYISRLEAENRVLSDRLTDMEEELDILESHSRRNNVKLFGIQETVGESFQACADKVVSILNEFFTDKVWHNSDVERAHRLGKPNPSSNRPRPIIVCFHRWTDKMMLFQQTEARTALSRTGVRVASDLTRRQVARLKEVQEEGKFGYFKNGKLFTRERYERGPVTQPDESSALPKSTDSRSDPSNKERREDYRNDRTSPPPPPPPPQGTGTAAEQERPPSPLYSDMVADRHRPAHMETPTVPVGNAPDKATTARNDGADPGPGNPHNIVNVQPTPVVGSSQTSTQERQTNDSRSKPRRGERVTGNTSRTSLRPATRRQSQSQSAVMHRDQPLISDSIRGAPEERRSSSGRQQNSRRSDRD